MDSQFSWPEVIYFVSAAFGTQAPWRGKRSLQDSITAIHPHTHLIHAPYFRVHLLMSLSGLHENLRYYDVCTKMLDM